METVLKDDVAKLRAEADSAERSGESPDEAAPGASPPGDQAPPPELVKVTTRLARAVGNMICRRNNVSPLEHDEAEAIGTAIAQLAIVYNIGNMDPKTAAWFGLGIAVVGVALPRMEQAERTIEAKASPAPPPSSSAEPPPPPPPASSPDMPYGRT